MSGRRIKVTASPRRPGDPAELVADVSLIGKCLAWNPRFDDLETIIRHALLWEEKCDVQRALLPAQENVGA